MKSSTVSGHAIMIHEDHHSDRQHFAYGMLTVDEGPEGLIGTTIFLDVTPKSAGFVTNQKVQLTVHKAVFVTRPR